MSKEDFSPEGLGHLHLHPLLYLRYLHFLQPVQGRSEVLLQGEVCISGERLLIVQLNNSTLLQLSDQKINMVESRASAARGQR